MKLNRSTIFLLIALLAIWGGIVYVIYDKLKGDETEQVMIKRTSVKPLVDSFSLKLDYMDPFGGIKYAVNTHVITRSVSNDFSTPSTAPQTAVSSDAIAYLGFIENKKSKNKSILLRIEGEEHVLQVGSVVGDYKIVKASDNDVTILWKKGLYVLKRE